MIKKHLGVSKVSKSAPIDAVMLTRHTMARTYELYAKVNILRIQNGLPMVEAPNLEPTMEMNPHYTYEQLERLMLEIRMLKSYLGVTGKNKQ